MNWDLVRAEYLAGGIGQRALAGKHGISYCALAKRARAEGWVALRSKAAKEDEAAKAGAAAEEDRVVSGADEQIALRLRKTLLMKLERAAQTIPCDATELKTQTDDGAVKLLKLRDLTAAFKELVGDLPRDGEESRVVIDV